MDSVFAQKRVSSLPEFPPLPRESQFPQYESSISEVKEAVKDEIPLRASPLAQRPRHPVFTPRSLPQRSFASVQPQRRILDEQKPLYVRLDTYKQVVQSLDKLQDMVAEAEAILSVLDDLQKQETKELTKFQDEVRQLKEKLLSVDKQLFEV